MAIHDVLAQLIAQEERVAAHVTNEIAFVTVRFEMVLEMLKSFVVPAANVAFVRSLNARVIFHPMLHHVVESAIARLASLHFNFRGGQFLYFWFRFWHGTNASASTGLKVFIVRILFDILVTN